MIVKPLVVEMHIARRSGLLTAPDPESRFQEMIARFSSPAGVESFFSHYPVLHRLCVQRVHMAVDVIAELMSGLISDRPHLEEAFGALGELTSLELGLGEPHRGGKTVIRLEFERGKTILRKPRSLLIDRSYHRLLDSLSAHLGAVQVKVPIIVDRGTHGYMEFIEHRPCASLAAVERFYYRHGVHLALIYLLGGSDLHQENVIACGEHPVLVDLETLFLRCWRSRRRALLGCIPAHSRPGDR